MTIQTPVQTDTTPKEASAMQESKSTKSHTKAHQDTTRRAIRLTLAKMHLAVLTHRDRQYDQALREWAAEGLARQECKHGMRLIYDDGRDPMHGCCESGLTTRQEALIAATTQEYDFDALIKWLATRPMDVTLPDEPIARLGTFAGQLLQVPGFDGLKEHHFDGTHSMCSHPEHTCDSQCDGCHTWENCVEADTIVGDLLLCHACKAVEVWNYPYDAETGYDVPQDVRAAAMARLEA